MSEILSVLLEQVPCLPPPAGHRLPTLQELADKYVQFLLVRTAHNITLTARILRISRSTLYGRLRRLDL